MYVLNYVLLNGISASGHFKRPIDYLAVITRLNALFLIYLLPSGPCQEDDSTLQASTRPALPSVSL